MLIPPTEWAPSMKILKNHDFAYILKFPETVPCVFQSAHTIQGIRADPETIATGRACGLLRDLHRHGETDGCPEWRIIM